MGTIRIYMRKDGDGLYFRDSEDDHGVTIQTSVDPGDTIMWTLDRDSHIKEITGISFNGLKSFFSKEPEMINPALWEAVVSEDATGEINYYPDVVFDSGVATKSAESSSTRGSNVEGESLTLKIRG